MSTATVQPVSRKPAHTRRGARAAVNAGSGVVQSCVCPPSSRAARDEFTSARLIAAIHDGLPVTELEMLQTSLCLPMEALAAKLGMSRATLHRRRTEGRLDRAESDRLVRFARLFGAAVEVFETPDNARRWLTSPQVGLGGAVPMDYADTEVGAREVEQLLGRIEHGVYS